MRPVSLARLSPGPLKTCFRESLGHLQASVCQSCLSCLIHLSSPDIFPIYILVSRQWESAAVPEIGNDLNLRNKRVPAAAAGGRASCSRTSVSPHPRPGRGHGSPAPLLSTSEVAGRPTQWLDVLTTCPETSRLYNGASQRGHTCNPSQGAEAGGLQVRV